ncbi:hypothetical protein BDZ89DRAFT_1206483 [Hymenopellis radicata]|nr:hypothetical protein BDZ89DRAFT_1206483 [Hymenopellis radicata]
MNSGTLHVHSSIWLDENISQRYSLVPVAPNPWFRCSHSPTYILPLSTNQVIFYVTQYVTKWEVQGLAFQECIAREGLGIKEAFFRKDNFIRFVIGFVIFLLQQWSGQNSVN